MLWKLQGLRCDPAVIAQERQELRQSQIVLMQSIQAMLQTQTDDRNARIAAAATQGVKYVPPPKTPAIPADLRLNTAGMDPIDSATAWRTYETKVRRLVARYSYELSVHYAHLVLGLSCNGPFDARIRSVLSRKLEITVATVAECLFMTNPTPLHLMQFSNALWAAD